jgi:hypothetical protein
MKSGADFYSWSYLQAEVGKVTLKSNNNEAMILYKKYWP